MTEQNGETRVRLLSGREVLIAPGSPKQSLAQIAGAQRGRVSTRQLLLAGFSRQMIGRAVAEGSLHRVHRGVYAAGHLADIELARETAALLAVSPAGVLTGLTALELYKALAADPRRPVHVAMRANRTARSRPGIEVHRYSRLLESQIRIRDGLPVTTAERALLDSAPFLTAHQLQRAFDEAIVTRATSRTKVVELLRVTGGRNGQAILAVLADPGRSPIQTKSPPERLAMALIRAAGLPAPETQYPMHGFTADFFWPQAGVVLEIDGFAAHGLVRRNFVRDRIKDRVFRDHGLHVVRVAADELDDHPFQIVAHLTRTITEKTLARELRQAS